MQYIIVAAIGYLLGSINAAYVLGRLHGFDIRERGTRNAGASNAKLTMGWYAFVITLLWDAFKAAAAMLIVAYLYPNDRFLLALSGIMAVFGHCFPLYTGFKGGKGFATLIGLTLMIDWKAAAIILIVSMLLAFLLNYIVVGTLGLATGFPVYLAFIQDDLRLIVLFTFIALIIIYRHKDNYQRLKTCREIGINGSFIGFKNGKYRH